MPVSGVCGGPVSHMPEQRRLAEDPFATSFGARIVKFSFDFRHGRQAAFQILGQRFDPLGLPLGDTDGQTCNLQVYRVSSAAPPYAGRVRQFMRSAFLTSSGR